ncbi:MAG: nickel-dependent hydrogenase large subunit [Peptococcaceae bacterium]|jgi:hydrogenase large subunit|nr:nickel-dependent hydrogenase large subunit [Peptococcaceae bacterium]
MAEKIIIDPITRIEGHLRVEVEVANGVVTDAHIIGKMFRGLEPLLNGRDPRDASYVVERVCGVCAGSHGWTSALALDEAFGAEVPAGGRIIRNLIAGAMWLHDHPLHFYHLSALDYLDIMAVARYQGSDPGLLGVKDKIVSLVNRNDTAPLTPRYEPDEFCVDDPELVTTAVAHYLKALEMQAKARKMSALFAGKQPHQSSIVVGGVTIYPTPHVLDEYAMMLEEQIDFIENVYYPDVITFGTGPLLPLAQANIGVGYGHFLSVGAFDRTDKRGEDPFFKAGLILNGDLSKILPVDERKMKEDPSYAWYKENPPLHPYDGDSTPDLAKANAYTYVKAPRYGDERLPLEVGPLSRMLVHQPEGLLELVGKYNIKLGAVARHAARAFETVMLCREMRNWVEALRAEMAPGKNFRIHDTEHWAPPKEGKGAGLAEAPRGALGHWVWVKNKKIANYQMIVPTTWNFAPRDEKGVLGPAEKALIGTPVPDVKNPINVARVLRSYDPCLACAIHLIDPDTNEVHKFRI